MTLPTSIVSAGLLLSATTSAFAPVSKSVRSSSSLNNIPPGPESYADRIASGNLEGLPESLIKAVQEQQRLTNGPVATADVVPLEEPVTTTTTTSQPTNSFQMPDINNGFNALFSSDIADDRVEQQQQQQPPSPSQEVPAYAVNIPGITAPLGFYDPLGLSVFVGNKNFSYLREAEIVHSRVAMLASVGFLTSEHFHTGPALYYLDTLPIICPVSILFFSTFFEFLRVDSTFGLEDGAILRTDYSPGFLGFDPLGLRPLDPKELKNMRTKEINNGRLAMIGIIGMLGQEFVTGKPIF